MMENSEKQLFRRLELVDQFVVYYGGFIEMFLVFII